MTEHQAFYNSHAPKSTKGIFRNILRQVEPKEAGIAYDLACGTGQLVVQIRAKGYQVYGLDISSEFIGKDDPARDSYLLVDVDELPFADASADLITFVDSLQYFPDYRATLGEIARVLKPNGLLILSCQNNYNLAGIKKYFLEKLTGRAWSPWLVHPVENFILYPELIKNLEAQGFELEYRRGKQFLTAWVSLLPGFIRNWSAWPDKPWRSLSSIAARQDFPDFIEESFLGIFASIILLRLRKRA